MTAETHSVGATGVLSRPDISEIVGEMPARACECSIKDCGGVRHPHGKCKNSAKWAARVHGEGGGEHGEFVFILCDGCIGVAMAIYSARPSCLVCGNSDDMQVMPL